MMNLTSSKVLLLQQLNLIRHKMILNNYIKGRIIINLLTQNLLSHNCNHSIFSNSILSKRSKVEAPLKSQLHRDLNMRKRNINSCNLFKITKRKFPDRDQSTSLLQLPLYKPMKMLLKQVGGTEMKRRGTFLIQRYNLSKRKDYSKGYPKTKSRLRPHSINSIRDS